MKLHDVLKNSFNIDESEINDDVKIMSYGEWDSMSHMFFITRLEEEYDIELTGDEIADMHTVGDIKKIIISKGKRSVMEVSQSRVLITGGGRGIGNFIANGLLQKSAKVIIVDHDKQLINDLPLHENLSKYQCDITDYVAVEKLINRIFETDCGINVCINNAGIIHSEPLVNILSSEEKKHSITNWQRVIDVNLNAVFYITSNVVEKMILKKQKGVIINISSISALGNIGQSAYAASKAGVEALTKTWSKELGMFKIRCACIAPGFFDTPSTHESLNENMLNKWQRSVPIARLGKLNELLSAVEFIIENEYFNGKVLALDGGLNL